jgi:hypothetical protein
VSCCPGGAPTFSERHRLRVRYQGGRSLVVKGPVTKAEYRFSGMDRVQLIDPRDAIGIIRSSLFRIEGVVELTPEPDPARQGRRDA